MRKEGKEAKCVMSVGKRGQIETGEDSRTARVNSETGKVESFDGAE